METSTVATKRVMNENQVALRAASIRNIRFFMEECVRDLEQFKKFKKKKKTQTANPPKRRRKKMSHAIANKEKHTEIKNGSVQSLKFTVKPMIMPALPTRILKKPQPLSRMGDFQSL